MPDVDSDPDSILVGAVFDSDDTSRVEAPAPPTDETPVRDYRPQEFDPRWKEPFTGLLYIGSLTSTETVFGHDFVISTPTQTERMQIGQVIAPYMETVSGNIAYATAFVAACLVSVDGRKLPEPVLNNPKETALHDRFKWVAENLRKPVVDELYGRCLELDMQVDRVLEAMGKA